MIVQYIVCINQSSLLLNKKSDCSHITSISYLYIVFIQAFTLHYHLEILYFISYFIAQFISFVPLLGIFLKSKIANSNFTLHTCILKYKTMVFPIDLNNDWKSYEALKLKWTRANKTNRKYASSSIATPVTHWINKVWAWAKYILANSTSQTFNNFVSFIIRFLSLYF